MILFLGALLFIILGSYYTGTWFEIVVIIYSYKIELRSFVIVLIILLGIITLQHLTKKDSNPFVIFLFWLIVIMITGLTYTIYVQSFFLNNPLDYFLKVDLLSIKISYSMEYRITFTKNYLLEFYAIFAEEDLRIGGDLTSLSSLEKAIELLPWEYLMNNIISFDELKLFCQGFSIEYRDSNRKLASTLVDLIEEENYYNSTLYNVGIFLRNSIVILLIPAILSKLLFSMGNFYFNFFTFRDLLNEIHNQNIQLFKDKIFDKAFTIVRERFWQYDFYMGEYLLEGVEREDFLKCFVVLLLRQYSSEEILEMAEEWNQ